MDQTDFNTVIGSLERLGGAGPIPDTPPPSEESQPPAYTVVVADEDDKKEIRHKQMNEQASVEYARIRRLLRSPADAWTPVEWPNNDGIIVKRMEDAVCVEGAIKRHPANIIAKRCMDYNKISRMSWDTNVEDVGRCEVVASAPELGINLEVQWLKLYHQRESIHWQYSQSVALVGKHVEDERKWIIIWKDISVNNYPPRRHARATARRDTCLCMVLTPLKNVCEEDSVVAVIPRTAVQLIGSLEQTKQLVERLRFLKSIQHF